MADVKVEQIDRDAVEVWGDAWSAWDNHPTCADDDATKVIEADRQATRAALVAAIVGDIRATMCDCSGKFIADEIEAKWGKQ